MEKLKKSSIETTVCIPLHKCDRVTQTKVTRYVCFALGEATNKGLKGELPWLSELIIKRVAQVHTYTLDKKAAYLLGIVAENTEFALLYLWYLQYWVFLNKESLNRQKEISFYILTKMVFPDGFFSTEDLSAIWQKQKLPVVEIPGLSLKEQMLQPSPNMVDYSRAGASIL